MSFISLFCHSLGIARRILCVKNTCFKVFFAVMCVSTLVMGSPGVFSPENPYSIPSRHYDVSVRLDVPLVLGIALTSALGVHQYYGMERLEANDLKNKSDFFPWDRPFVGHYNDWATTVSHYSAVLAVAPFALAGYSWFKGDADAHDFGAYSIMLVEAFLLQNALNQIVRSSQLWPRPYVYSKGGKGAEKAGDARGEAYGSFYSGHASAAFTVAVFTGEWFSEIYPNSKYKSIVWASSFALAAGVGALRVVAGKHYPTDVVVGSLVGAGVSLGIIKIHEICKKNISFWVIPNNFGVIFYF